MIKIAEINDVFKQKNELIKLILSLPNPKEVLTDLQHRIEEESRRRKEFYNNLRPDEKKEFINGEIFIHSPAKWSHLKITLNLATKIKQHLDKCNCGVLAVEKALIRLTRNDFEPDLAFWTLEKAKDFKADQMLFPPPDFVVEVLSPSTEENDRGIKFIDYALHGVKEYWIIDPDKKIIEQYLNKDQGFELYQKLAEGTISSKVIEGLKIELKEIFS